MTATGTEQVRHTALSDVPGLAVRVYESSRERKHTPRTDESSDVHVAHQVRRGITGDRPLMDVLRSRKATRAYGDESISLDSVLTMLSVASEGDQSDWTAEHIAAPLEYRLVAWNVRDLTPAIYAFDNENQTLNKVHEAPDRAADGSNLVLQPEFARAAAIVLITGALGSAIEEYGAWGHQNLLVRAGAAGHRLWLASLACGLVGTVFAGFLPRAAQQLAGVDGYRRAGLFAYATGASRNQPR